MFSKGYRTIATLILAAFLTSQLTWAQDLDLTTGLAVSRDLGAGKVAMGNEFISGDYPGAVLMRVNLWGAVGKPGIHLVPNRTDLITLLSYAGGPTQGAQLDDIYIKRYLHSSKTKEKEEIIRVNGEEILRKSGVPSPLLSANDIVVIPTKKPLIGSDTLAVVSFIGGILSIVTVAIVLAK